MQLPAWQRAESVSKQHPTGRKHDERDLKQRSWWEIPQEYHTWQLLIIAPYTSGQIVLYFLNLNCLDIFEGFRCKEFSNGGHDEGPTQTSCTMRRKIPEKLPAIYMLALNLIPSKCVLWWSLCNLRNKCIYICRAPSNIGTNSTSIFHFIKFIKEWSSGSAFYLGGAWTTHFNNMLIKLIAIYFRKDLDAISPSHNSFGWCQAWEFFGFVDDKAVWLLILFDR